MATLKFKLNDGKIISGSKELSNELIFGTLGIVLESRKNNGRINVMTEGGCNEEVSAKDIGEITLVL